MKKNKKSGYTLIELIVAVGLFALVMMLVSGAYLMMISVTRQAQGLATGIDNLSFTLETMTRTIRTGTNYSCNGGWDCSGGTTFSVKNSSGTTMTYTLSGGAITQTQNGVTVILTDPSVNVTSLKFYVSGTPKGNSSEPHATITVSGTVSSGPGKTETFWVETGATMRGIDL
jgi:prepilin-type N-terminal cleavage/methylation domain-containing protein